MAEFVTSNGISVLAAAFASFLFGSAWYMALGKAWMTAADLVPENQKPEASVMIITFVCQMIMAACLSGIMFHVTELTIRSGLISALVLWFGLVLTTMIVNHRFQGKPWSLTLIDGGHWLGVLLVQGTVIGAMA